MAKSLSHSRISRHLAPLLLVVGVFACAVCSAAPLSGLWHATVHVGSIDVPFGFGISVKDSQASGWFFNGQQKITSSSGSYRDGHLLLEFASYAKQLQADVDQNGNLNGTYSPTTPRSTTPAAEFHARRATTQSDAEAGTVPSISGVWVVPAPSSKANEKAWRLFVEQRGARVSAAILRVDGDSGALTGNWHDGKLVLSHFDGARPALMDVTPSAGGTLQLVLHSRDGTNATLTAYRPADASAKGLPEAADPATHTGVKNPAEPLQFSFPDLSGQLVSNTDGRFKGKVLLLDISGSWCPNCHDEAPFLQAMYRKYHHRGLEIVTLNFEDSPEQLSNPVRLHAFIKDFGIQYIVLQAGTTEQLHDKLPQAVNLDAYPTTFFIGRDGLVHATHAGFAAAATGSFNAELKKAFASKIEGLLATAATPARDPPAAHP